MIYYNKQMADALTLIGKGLLRHHTAPDSEKLEKYENLGLNAGCLPTLPQRMNTCLQKCYTGDFRRGTVTARPRFGGGRMW